MSSVDDIFNEFVDYDADVDDLERVVEGRLSGSEHSDDEGARSDEAEEERPKEVREPVDPRQKRVVKNPRVTLNPARLTGPRGVQAIRDHFKDFKFKGKGHEKEDLDVIMKTLEHWAHRLYPKFTFDDCLDKIEHLGNKKMVSVQVTKIHLNMLNDMPLNEMDSDDENITNNPVEVQEKDDFDLLLEQQIALARSTPASSTKFTSDRSNINLFSEGKQNTDALRVPLAHQSNGKQYGVIPEISTALSDEQKLRILKNRQLAEEKRKTKLQLNNLEQSTVVANDKENINNCYIVNEDELENDDTSVVLNKSYKKKVTHIIINDDDDSNNSDRAQNNNDLPKSNSQTTDEVTRSIIDIISDVTVQVTKKKRVRVLIDSDSSNSDGAQSNYELTKPNGLSTDKIANKKLANIVIEDESNDFDNADIISINYDKSNFDDIQDSRNTNIFKLVDSLKKDNNKDFQEDNMKLSKSISGKSVDNIINIDDKTNDTVDISAEDVNINEDKNNDVGAFFNDEDFVEAMDID